MIGVFDSGLGGLSVLREIRQRMPLADLFYYADSAHVPYGNKSPEFIVERSRRISEFLLGHGARALVIACNTATAAAAAPLRVEFPDIPIVGMEPAVKPAVAATKSGVVGVLATVGTLQSAQFAGLLGKFSGGARVVAQAAPGLVECVESGDIDSVATRSKVASFVRPLLEKGADVIVLGCTHYPFLRSVIQEIAGPQVVLIDTGLAVARQLERRLDEAGISELEKQGSGRERFFTSADPAGVEKAAAMLWQPGAVVEFAEV